MAKQDVFQWIEENFAPIPCTSDQFVYDDMASQSGFSLPLIYQPFDGRKKSHWNDRGSTFDFLYATAGEGQTLLDFGPGDGWPSLNLAPYVNQVVGVDASKRRIEVCRQNAKRLGMKNASFEYYHSGSKLPFPDGHFDAVTAASSVEQSPNPKETLAELYRVLKPGGRLRMDYEALNRYANGHEQDLWLMGINSKLCRLILFNRRIPDQAVTQYGITLAMPKEELQTKLAKGISQVTIEFLQGLEEKISRVQVLTTIHPSGKTYVAWLREVGFSQVIPTHSGKAVGEILFASYSSDNRPTTRQEVDLIVAKGAQIAIELAAPLEIDPMLTAVK